MNHSLNAVIIFTSLLLALTAHASNADYAVCAGEKPGPITLHAAQELSGYIGRLIGKPVGIKSTAGYGDTVFVVGGPGENPVAGKLAAAGALRKLRNLGETAKDAYEQERLDSSFAIQSFGDRYVILAGKTPRGTLYAVYHYLDECCGVGFFEDGERVPHLKSLPVSGLDRVEKPRFAMRFQFAWDPRCLLTKSVSTLWRADVEWKDYFDWMAKNKQNWVRMDWNNPYRIGYGLYAKTWPGYERPKSGFVPEWWPADFAYQNTKRAIDYGRLVGIKYWSDGTCNVVPREAEPLVRAAFPNALISKPDTTYSYIRFIRDRATNVSYYERNLAAAIASYGKPDLYWAQFPVFEEEACSEYSSTWDPNLSNAMASVTRKHDPQARFLIDGWLVAMRFRDKPETLKPFLEKLDYPFVINTSYPYFAPHELFDYYWGRPFVYTEIDGFGGQDHYHLFVPYPELMRRARDLAENPKSNCVGFGTIPELIGYDPLLRYAYGRLSWDPLRYRDWHALLREFVLKRYGRKAFAEMYRSYDLLARALGDNRPNTDPYISGFCPVYRHHQYLAYPTVRDWWRRYASGESLALLESSLAAALAESGRFDGDDLYEKYLAGLFHSYAAELHKFALIKANQAYGSAVSLFKRGITSGPEVDAAMARFDSAAAQADLALAMVERVWSTRPELSIEKETEAAMSVPGASPLLARTIRLDSALFEEGAYETMAWWYRPVCRAFMDDLRARIARREKDYYSGPVANEFSPFNWVEDSAKRWHEVPIHVNDSELRPKLERLAVQVGEGTIKCDPPARGSTTAVVTSALVELRSVGLDTAGLADMLSEELIARNYPFPND